MAQKAFITGISGFAGSYLAPLLLQNNFEVSGTYLTEESVQNLSPNEKNIQLFQLDLTDFKKLTQLIEKVKPDWVFHLAALSSPAESFSDPSKNITENIELEVHLLEAIRKAKIDPRILIVSSAVVYGLALENNLPMNENTPFVPTNPYAVSKIAQDFLALQYYISYGMNIVRVRPFNHIGPRQSPSFVVASFAKKIAEIEKGKQNNILKVGDLKPKRDLTDVRDVVVGYKLLLEKGKAGDVYNLGSGTAYPISEILEKMLKLSSKKIIIEEDAELMRPSDIPILLCDNAKIKKEIGWEPTIPLEQTLKDTLDYWRQIV